MDAGRQPCNTQGLETQNSTPEPHTTPKHHIHLPPTPPATDEPPIHASSVPFLDGVQTLEAARRASEQSTPWTQVQLDPTAYDLISGSLENGFRRHDFDRGAGVLSFRMPSPVHDFFSTFLADDIHDWLKRLAAEGGESGEFAAKIANGGSSRIFLREGDLGRPCEPVRRQPDAQFQHDHTAYPGVVVEISYSQDGKTLEKLAQDYILLSNGDINAVIGIDINYGGKVSTVSVWRPLYTREGHDEYLEAEQHVAYKPFRGVDGLATNEGDVLSLRLSDFATDAISHGHESVEFSLPFERLHELLARAEQIQRSRESNDDRGRVISQRKTKRRRPSSSPAEKLGSDDEARYLGQEERALQQAEKVDDAFSGPTAKRRA